MLSNITAILLFLLPSVVTASSLLHHIFTSSASVVFRYEIMNHMFRGEKSNLLFYTFSEEQKNVDIPMFEHREDLDYKIAIINVTSGEQIGSTIHRRMQLKKSDDYLEDVYLINHIRFSVKTKLGCAEKYYGPQCENLCQGQEGIAGHSRCDQKTGQFRCKVGWMGPRCSQVINPRECNCQNSGSCVATTTNASALECECKKGFIGPKCDVIDGATKPINNSHICSPEHICLNGGKCSQNGLKRYCECPTGFVGEFCQAVIDDTEDKNEGSTSIKWEILIISTLLVVLFFAVRHIRRRRNMFMETSDRIFLIDAHSMEFSGIRHEEEPIYPTVGDIF